MPHPPRWIGCLLLGALATIGAAERTVIAHLMPTEGIAFHSQQKPEQWSQLATRLHAPSADRGGLAQHDPAWLPFWDQPATAAVFDLAVAREGGIDALAICGWGNPWDLGTGWEHAAHYWRAAGTTGLRAAPDWWIDGGKPEEFARLGTLLGRIRRDHDAAWLRLDGRRAVFLSPTSATRLVPYAEAMAALCRDVPREDLCLAVVANRGRELGLFGLDDPAWRQGADRTYSWDSRAWLPARRNLEAAMAAGGRRHLPGCMTALALCRSYSDDAGGREKRIQENLGPVKLAWFWRSVIAGGADAAYLSSWNDLSEDHALMPESNHGWAFYRLNQHYARWFRQGVEPRPEAESVLLFHHPQPVAGVELPAGRLPFVDHRWREAPGEPTTPPTDYLAVVGLLREPATVRLYFGAARVAERELPAGVHHWLAYHPNPLAAGWGEAYPADQDWLTTTRLEQPFGDAWVHLEVRRGDRRLGFFRSHRPIAAAAARSDLTTVGNVFALP